MSKQSLRRSRRFEMMNKKNKKKIPLKQLLDGVYYGTVDLDTTCQGLCECCKVAMPQMNYCEFTQLINEVWKTSSRSEKIEMICKSVEYFLHNEFEKFAMKTLIKPCMLLSDEGKCKYYDFRPLSCRLYGLWPKDMYKERVDKFEKAYDGLLERNQLPLNTQCPNVKRKDNSKLLTKEIIDSLFGKLDVLDTRVGSFTPDQISQRENYRTFHDWLLLKIFKEDWLVKLTNFMIAASHGTIDAQIDCLKDVIRQKYAKEMPDLEL